MYRIGSVRSAWRVQHSRCCSSLQGKVLAIRRESQSIWERRAPLSPGQVKQLVKQGAKVIVQPSNRRSYPLQEYINCGAVAQEEIGEASLIMGVKQVPIDELIQDKTYSFFSHTIKAQPDNMALLDAILEKNIRLIDYERLVDKRGKRLVAFGMYAGVAGMINILHGLGLRLLAMGHHTPFMYIGPAHNYRSSSMASQAVRDAGYEISLGLMPKSIGPITFIFTGAGNVSKGAQSIFQELPYEFVEPKNLKKVAEKGALNKVYGCVVDIEDNLIRKEGGPINLEEFNAHPERYASYFAEAYAPYASVIINGIFWAPGSPRLITTPDAKRLIEPSDTPWLPRGRGTPSLPHRLIAICDISADPGGSIQFIKRCTTIDALFELYDAEEHIYSEKIDLPGVLVCSVDNMPAQLPREATDFFGNLLVPFVPHMLASVASSPWDMEKDKFHPIVRDAVITSNGELTPQYKYIDTLRKESKGSKLRKRPVAGSSSVLILGSGYVSAPVVDYLARDKDVHVTVASELMQDAERLVSGHSNATSVSLDILHQPDRLEKLINEHALVISLLPFTFHPNVAKLCIKNKTNLMTASYLSAEMRELQRAAVEADITVVNEVGLDPGIDHLLAMNCFDEAKDHGARITSFQSYCGGLPAPEHSDNPLRYKFSWSPRAVLNNTLGAAKYLQNGQVFDIPPGGALLDAVRPIDFLPGFSLEGIPNRDSTLYSQYYGIESTSTLLRGTLRYKGFCDAVKGLLKVGLLSTEPHPSLHSQGPDITWKEFMCTLVGKTTDIFGDSLKESIYQRLGEKEHLLDMFERLELLDDKELVVKKDTPLDTLSHHLARILAYGTTERDMIILRHIIDVRYPDSKTERSNIGLVVYGEPGRYSAMAKTVGLPCAIAAKMMIQGEIQQKGMVLPFTKDIYRPMLSRLAQEGVKATVHVDAL